GTLRSRKFEDALIRDPAEAGWQALRIVERGAVIARDGTEVSVDAQTLCIHGDTPGAPEIAATVARILREAGVTLGALSRPCERLYECGLGVFRGGVARRCHFADEEVLRAL